MPAQTRIAELNKTPLRGRNRVMICLLTLCFLYLPAGDAGAGTPEYMKLNPRIGLGIEVEGFMNDQGQFEATDIEPLANPRRLKLRGELTIVDSATGTVVMLGRRIVIDDETEIEGTLLSKLKPGRRGEIKVKVSLESGVWTARSLVTGDVKGSDKIKGTITDMSVDGVAPDTLFIEGFPVLLVEQTDLAAAILLQDRRQRYHYRQMALTNARGLHRGHSLFGGKMGLRVQYRQSYRQEDDFDLSANYDSDLTTTEPEVRARLFVYFNNDLRINVDGRVRRKYILKSDLDRYHDDPEFQLRQAFVLWRNIAGGDLALSVGRQKFRERRQWLWDDYLDGARLFLFGSGLIGIQVSYIDFVDHPKVKFATWTDLYLGTDFHLDQNNTLTAYFLRRWDSDETRNREPVWWGLRFQGEPTRAAWTWMDLAIMNGTDKHKKLRAWALDLGGSWQFRNTPWRPSLTVAYAFGSGDEHGTPEVDGEFRQTGYEDNAARFGGVTSVLYYGAVLDPELSNLVIATLGAGVRPARDFSLDLLYHRYRQDWSADEVNGNLVDPPARPNGQNSDIGWELDLVIGIRHLWGAVRAAWTVGVFTPGEAYAPRRERALLNKLHLTVEI